jgi:hypothetical protein
MEYTVKEDFVDIHDDSHLYRAGEKYPRPGVSVSEERITELSSSHNRVGRALIEAAPVEVIEPPVEPPEDDGKEIPVQPVKTSGRGRRSRKKEG